DADNVPPTISVSVLSPAGAMCGATITPADDSDATAPGVQVSLRMFTNGAVTRTFTLGGVDYPAGSTGIGSITVVTGMNAIQAVATDENANTATFDCPIDVS